ncbi:hypothetical protein [Peribacillus sp. NPDC101480]|uniref:hypothetical protein n=1 Tax=Peribacillus sp. NPDC101480 TaxID=3390620 RepID=UPI003D03C4FC
MHRKKLASGTKFVPYSKEFAQKQVQKVQATITDIARSGKTTLKNICEELGKKEMPKRISLEQVSLAGGPTLPQIVMEKQTIKEAYQKFTVKDSKVEAASGESVPKGKVKGITKGEYKNLRKKTPSNEIRKMVNPDGPKVDPVYGYEVDKFEADHIVSMKEITEIEGFSRLTREQQIEILNLKDNFVGLGKSSNASKGAHSWADWKGHSKMGEVPVNVRMEMLEKEEQAREVLKVAKEERLK